MRLTQRVLAWSMIGAVVGSLTALAAPQTPLTAAEEAAGCTCDDFGTGNYQCDRPTSSTCEAGSEMCKVICS